MMIEKIAKKTKLYKQRKLLKTEFSIKFDTKVPIIAEKVLVPRKNPSIVIRKADMAKEAQAKSAPVLTKLIQSLSKRGVQAFPKISATKNQQEIKVGQTNIVKESREDVWRDEPVVGNNVLEENSTKEVKDEPKQTIKDFFNDDEANEEKAKIKEYFSDDVKDFFDNDIKDLFDDFAADDDEPHIFYHNGNPIGKYHPLSWMLY